MYDSVIGMVWFDQVVCTDKVIYADPYFFKNILKQQ